KGDNTRLEQVLVNLLTNAAKYTDSGGCIELQAERQNGRWAIKIEDNGIGMSPELIGRAFDLFAQGDRSIARSEGGLGIGLTLVKRLVEMHGGSVTATSPGLGKGSLFTVYLPAVDAPEFVYTVPRASPVLGARSARILVVDDKVETAQGLAKLLQLSGYEV